MHTCIHAYLGYSYSSKAQDADISSTSSHHDIATYAATLPSHPKRKNNKSPQPTPNTQIKRPWSHIRIRNAIPQSHPQPCIQASRQTTVKPTIQPAQIHTYIHTYAPPPNHSNE